MRLRVFFSRLADFLLRRQRDQRLSLEIQQHLDALADTYRSGGMSEQDARAAALRAFGGVDRVKILHREQRSLPVVDALMFDLRTAVRAVARERGFSLGVVVVLALGLAVNTTIFTIVNGMTWRSLPVERGDRIMQLSSLRLQPRRAGTYTSYADFQDWRAAARSFVDLAAYRAATLNLGDDAQPADRLAGNFITSNTFRLLGMQPVVGRDFSSADDAPGAAPIVILGHHVWRARYGGDHAIVGRTIRLNGIPTTVIGVMPDGFQFPIRADAWRPVAQMPNLDTVKRDARSLDVVGRLRDGVTAEEAGTELDAITSALAAQYPNTNADMGARVVVFTHAFVAPPPQAREPLVMMIAAAIVLLIACANGANLLLARALRRTREIALRATLGASRFRVVRQLLVEALVMSTAAAAVGLALSKVAIGFFVRETADLNLPYWIAFAFDLRVFAYVAIACLGTAVLFGLVPALQLSRTSANDILKEGGRGALGERRVQRWAGALLVGELALTLTLLGAASILVRSSAALGQRDALLDLDDLFAAHVGLPAGRYDTAEKRRALYTELQQRLDRASAIPSATLSSVRPFVESTTYELRIEGVADPVDQAPTIQAVGAGAHYFATLDVQLRRGRELQALDSAPGREGVVINERLAQVYFPGADPIGRRIHLTGPGSPSSGRWFAIVGVSPSIRQRTMADIAPLVYVPLDVQLGPTLGVIARGGHDLPRTTTALREVIRAVDPDIAAYSVSSLRRLSETSRWPARMVSFVLALFATIASVLSIAGLYGMTAYGVAHRTAEIGLRVALGARRTQVAWLVLHTTLVRVSLGLAIGLAGVVGVGQVLRGLLTGSSGADPAILAALAGSLVLITCAACVVPAWRAMRLDPGTALRRE